MASPVEREADFIEWVVDFMNRCDQARRGYLGHAEQAQFLHDTVMQRWEPGTTHPITDSMSLHPGAPHSSEPMIKGVVRDASHILLKHDPMLRVRSLDVTKSSTAEGITVHLYEAWTHRVTNTLKRLRLALQTAFLSGLEVLAVEFYRDTVGELHHLVSIIPRVDFWSDPVHSDIEDHLCVRRYWFSEKQLTRIFGDVEDFIHQGPPRPFTRYHMFDMNQYDWSGTQDTAPPDWWGPSSEGLYPVYECWIPNRYLDPDHFTDRQIDQSPFGRVVTILAQEVMKNVPNPNAMLTQAGFIGHRSHPFVQLECFRVCNRDGYSPLYAVEGIVHDVEEIQWEVNELARLAFIGAQREAEPNYWVAEGQTRGTDHLAHLPGRLFRYDPMVAPTPPIEIRGPNLNSLIAMLNIKQNSLRDVSGVRGPIVGGDPAMGTSHTPASTLRQIQESSTIRLWGPLGNLENAIYNVGWRLLGNIQQHKHPGEYASVVINGKEMYTEWTLDHIYNSYRLEVVAGMSTVLRDLDRLNLSTQIFNTVAPVFLNPTPHGLRTAQAYLSSLQDPMAFEYLQVAQELLQQLNQQQFNPQQPQLGGLEGLNPAAGPPDLSQVLSSQPPPEGV